MKTIERLFDGPLDIVGDVHGHLDALRNLMRHLDYDEDGSHPDGRRLVFVGDLVDRGPDSPGVVEHVMHMVDAGHAQCVLGNHELNIARNCEKPDNRWFFDNGGPSVDGQRAASVQQQESFRRFFNGLPLALEHEDLRVVHACWDHVSIARLKALSLADIDIGNQYRTFRTEVDNQLESDGALEQYRKEQALFDDCLRFGKEDPYEHWPEARFLEGHAAVDEARQMRNPIAVLTSGEERAATRTYPAGGKFRFVNRIAWWNDYSDAQAVIIGHYWRLSNSGISNRPRAVGIDVFKGTSSGEWLGARKNVYCVDFSIGGRGEIFRGDTCRLAAARWPEVTVVFDNGEELATDYRNR